MTSNLARVSPTTKAEKRLWRALRQSGMQGWVPEQKVSGYRVDFYNPFSHISVEADGRHHYEDDIQVQHDRRRTRFLTGKYHVKEMRFSNMEIMSDIRGVIAKIKAEHQKIVSAFKDPAYWAVKR